MIFVSSIVMIVITVVIVFSPKDEAKTLNPKPSGFKGFRGFRVKGLGLRGFGVLCFRV